MHRRRRRPKKGPDDIYAKKGSKQQKGPLPREKRSAPKPTSYIADHTPPPLPPVEDPASSKNVAIPESYLSPKTTSPQPEPEVEEIDDMVAPVVEDDSVVIEQDNGDIRDETEIDASTSQSEVIEATVTATPEVPSATSEPAGPAAAAGKVRSIGLRKNDETKKEVKPKPKVEDYTKDLISQSKQSARDSGIEVAEEVGGILSNEELLATILPEHLITPKSASEKQSEEKRRLAQKRKRARAEGAPVKRVVKLNRRKYMEFKVDLREIMQEEDVAEEERAGLLGSTWAKGERQGIDDAIEFISEKCEDGILSEDAANRIIKVLKGYKTKR